MDKKKLHDLIEKEQPNICQMFMQQLAIVET